MRASDIKDMSIEKILILKDIDDMPKTCSHMPQTVNARTTEDFANMTEACEIAT